MIAPQHCHAWPIQAPDPPPPERNLVLPLALTAIGAALTVWIGLAWRTNRKTEHEVEEATRRRLGHTGHHVVPSAADIHVKCP